MEGHEQIPRFAAREGKAESQCFASNGHTAAAPAA